MNRIIRLVFVAASGLDCLSGSVACPSLVLAVGLTADRAGRVRFLRGALLLAGRGSALVIAGLVVRSCRLAGHPLGLLVLPVFLDGWLLSACRGGGSRRGSSRLAA
jgi:hypothetical protein